MHGSAASAARCGRARCTASRRKAFTLLEVVIVAATMAVIASIAVPRITRALSNAGATSTLQDWNVLQRQIDLFALEHHGRYPGQTAAGEHSAGSSEAFVAHMTMPSNSNGDVKEEASADVPLGPYIVHQIPALKAGVHAGSARVLMAKPGLAPEFAPDEDAGWVYQCETGEIVPNVPLARPAGGGVAIDLERVGGADVSAGGKVGDLGAGR